MSRFDRMTDQDWAIRDAINEVLKENNRPMSDYTYSAVPDETPTLFVEQPSVQGDQGVDSGNKIQQSVAPYTDYFSLLNPGETPASALESKLSQMQSMPDLSTEPVSSGKWWAGETPTYAESVAQLYRIQDTLTPDQFNAYATRLDAAKNDPASGFYQNPYTGITSPYVDAISKLGIDVSGGINDEWIAKNQYLLQGARYTDAGTTPAAPTKTSTPAQNAAYYYYQIQRNYADTQEVLKEIAGLQADFDYWVGRDDLNLSDDDIFRLVDIPKNYKYLQGLQDARKDGHVYNYTSPIDYNPDNLRGMLWAARNDGGTGNSDLDAINAALGRGNVWKENKEIHDKLTFGSDSFAPYTVKGTLDGPARYFGKKEFEPGWAEKVAKDINWDNQEEVKNWQLVYNAEKFTSQAESEAKTIKDRVDFLIASGITDPVEIENGLWDKWGENDPALSALKKLDDSLVRPDKLVDTTRPIDYSKKGIQDYIKQQVAKATGKESLPAFGMRVTEMMGTNIVHGNGQAPAQVNVAATVAPTSTPGVNPTDKPRGTDISATDRILNTPTSTPAPDIPVLGNIDIYNRTPVVNPDGSISTVDSFSVNIDGKEVLLPTIIAGKRVSQDEAIDHYYETGEYLGKFDTIAEADDYAQKLHEQQERLYGNASDRILNTPAPTATSTPVPTPTPKPVVNQSAQAVGAAQTKTFRDAAKTILATGTPDEKMVLSLAPTANAEGVAAEMAGSVQTGTANAGTLYETTAKQAQDYTAANYMLAKRQIQHYDDMQAQLTELQAQQAALQEQHDQVQYQVDRGIVPGVAQTEVQINGEAHVFTADYDPTSKEYIIHDSNPTDSAEVKRQKADYANTLRYGLNMDETYLEKDNQLLVAAENLNMELTAVGNQISQLQDSISAYKTFYDQAQEKLKTSESMINAAAMQSVWKNNPGLDLSTPEGQQALAEALAQEKRLTSGIDLVMDVGSQYVPTQWEPETILQAMADNGASSEEIARAGEEIVAESKKGLDELTGAIDQLQASGASIPREYKENLERKKKTYEDQIKSVEYYSLQNKPGFDDTVNASLKAVTDDINTNGGIFHPYKYNETSRFVAMALNGETPDIDTTQGNTPETSRWTAVALMRDDELKTYMYKLEESEEAATEYFNRLIDPSNGALHTRAANRQEEVWGNFADEHPVLALATSVAMSPAAAIPGGLYTAYSLATGQEINPNSGMFGGQTAQKAIEPIAKEKILAPLEKGSVLYKLADLGLTGGIEATRSALNKIVYGPANLVMMGLGTASSNVQDVKQIGGSNTQAAIMGGINFAAETLGEIIPDRIMTKAFEKGETGEGFFKGLLKDMAENSLGEMATEIAEKVPEDYVLGKLSTRNRAIAEYEQTMSHEDAVKQADKDFWHDVLMAGATGAVMSVGSSGLGYAAGRLSSVGTGNTTQPSAEGQVRATALANGLPLDRTTQDMTARTVTMLTSSLNADKGSQVQALSAALFPVSGDAQGQRAAVSAGLHMANQFGSEQAVAVAQDVILAAAQEGTDQQAVSEAMRIAALGQGEASAVLDRISQNGVEFGDVQALVDAAGRDAQNPAIADRMQAIIHNDRVASRTRDLIGQGALNGVKPYEQAYSQAKAQEAQTRQNLEAEQERAKAIGEHLQTVQAQHVEDPANPALAGAMKQAVKDVAGQVKVVGEYQQGLENQQQKTQDAEKDLNRVREEAMTKVREQAIADVQAEEQAEAQAEAEAQAAAEATALAEAEAQAQAEQAPASNPNAGTIYTNDQVPVSYHWALVPASDLVTSNTDTGEANSAYPAELQPRDRTRAASQDQVAGMVRNLNPARLGESADAQNGAPIVGPDNVVESGNARTMAIRQAMASNPESAARYTQYMRDNAARFGLNPDDVTDNSVLVRVRDTDLDRVAFARAANESTTAGYSPSENARSDAERLTPRMMEQFAPSDAGRLDNTENHAFALAFLNEIIPESERGAYMQDDGSISQQGYDRIRNAVFQRAYGSTALTQVLTEDTDGGSRNVMNALLKAAPRMMALQDAVSQGEVYDTGLPQKIAEAAQRYMELKNAGMSVETYLGQTVMPGFQTEDETTQAFMRLFEEYRRSGKKLAEALANIADVVEEVGDPRAISFLGDVEVPSLPELIRQGVEKMIKPKDNTVMNEKADDDVPTLVGELPPDTEGNESTENLPERETYTLDLSAGTPPSGNGPTTTEETPPANGPQRQFGSQTAQRSDLLHEEVKQYLRENSSYDPDSNNEQLDRAAGWVQEHSNDQDPDGYYGAVAEAQSPDFNAFSADGQARMLTLMSMAALRGDVATETALADAYNQQGTVLGRALQSRQIFGMLTPLGRQAVLLKETDRINKQYADRGQTTRVALSPDTLDKAGKAKTAEDFQRVQKQAYKELAEQMPPTWKDKLQAWRMLSMLGNPRTHVRNFFGNWLFMPAVKLKNVIGTAIEGVAVKPGSGEMRTKSLTVSKENRDFAKADAIKMKDVLTGESKYNPDQKVEQERKIFGKKDNFLSRTVGKALQWLSDKNSEWLEKEDWAFLHRHYENALGGWMNANKLTPETITPEQLTQAREYAINEAQKATYRDANKIASLLADISRKGGVTGFIVDTALPFKKTPANILKRGIEYSPIGLIRTLAADTKKVKQYTDWVKNGSKGTLPKNAISPTQYIDRISSGLSGTATAALGALFASLGLVTVGYDDDKKTLEELEGKQEYALNIKIGDANVSYTIDWAAPFCMPFFVGASIYNIFQEGINDPGQIADALLEITEPVFNLSMLDGVNSLMETSQWSGGNAFTQIGEKLATNYLSSFIPTVVGQASRTIDPVRRKSYVESGASLSTWRYAFEQAQNKTPFSVSNIPYRNVWGDEDRSPEWLAAIENFISPGYINKITPGKVEKELASLYDETGDAKVIPQAASKSPYIGGQQVKLNAEQYDQYTTVRGTTAKKLLEELMDRPEWALLDGEAKIDVIGQAWTYSNAVAAKDLFPNSKMTAWIQAAQKKGNAAEAIIQRHEEQAKKDYVKGHKESLFNAVDQHDVESFQTSMYALADADKQEKAAQGKKSNPAYVTNLLVNQYKPLYIAAINDGDTETAETIRDNLLSMPMTGIDARTILSWQYEAEKNKTKR